jgi:hypothetical protein
MHLDARHVADGPSAAGIAQGSADRTCTGYASPLRPANARICRVQCWGWRPGRVYFLTLLEPSRDDRTLALTGRWASRLPR